MSKLILLSLMILIGIPSIAQTNFSGTWELAKSKSKLKKYNHR